jgi:hypothetical protein
MTIISCGDRRPANVPQEIDLIFQQPTRELVKQNAASAWQTTRDLCAFRFRKVFVETHTPRRASIVEQLTHDHRQPA